MANDIFILISEETADLLWPEGWTEDELREKGFLIDKKIEEDDLTLWPE